MSLKFINSVIMCIAMIAGTFAQKKSRNITISEQLANSSTMYKVKMKAVMLGNQLPAFRFAEYQMLKSKRDSYEVDRDKDRKASTVAFNELWTSSFFMCNGNKDSIKVSIVRRTYTKELESSSIIFDFGGEGLEIYKDIERELLSYSDFLTAELIPLNNPGNVWHFIMGNSGDETLRENVAFLKKDSRIIRIYPVTSTTGKQKMLGLDTSAKGFEFIEDEQSLGAVQCRGRGATQYTNKQVWLRNNQDPELEHVVASTMGMLMQVFFYYP